MSNTNPTPLKICGTSHIGVKGQLVIPKDVRDKVGLQPGDSVVILLKSGKFIGIIKSDDLENIIEYARLEGIKIELS